MNNQIIAESLIKLAKELVSEEVEAPEFDNHHQQLAWNKLKHHILSKKWTPKEALVPLKADLEKLKKIVKKKQDNGQEAHLEKNNLDVCQKAIDYYEKLK